MSDNMTNRVLEQETDREAGKSITITYTPIGAVLESEKESKLQEQGEDADIFFMRNINATFGFKMLRNSWDAEHDNAGGFETTTEYTRALRIGNETKTTFIESELVWFEEVLMPLLIDQSAVEIINTQKEVTKRVTPLGKYEHFDWDETPEWHDDRVTLEYIDLSNGKASILVKGESGSDISTDEVNGAVKGYHHMIMSTIRSMTCTDEAEYSRDCRSLLKVESHRVCETDFLDED